MVGQIRNYYTEWRAKFEVTELLRPWIGHLSQNIGDLKNWYQDCSNECDFCNQSRKSILSYP